MYSGSSEGAANQPLTIALRRCYLPFTFYFSVFALAVPLGATFDLSGKWRLTLEMEVGRATPLLELTEKSGKLTGTYTGRYGESPVAGTVEGTKVAFTVAMQTTALEFRGDIKEDGTLAGTATFGEMGDVKWTAAREK